MRKTIITIIFTLALILTMPASKVNACGLLTMPHVTATIKTYKDGCKKIEIKYYSNDKIIKSYKAIKKGNKRKAHKLVKESWEDFYMTDVNRLNHLYKLLKIMSKDKKADTWGRFVKTYHPTELEQTKLKALYRELKK